MSAHDPAGLESIVKAAWTETLPNEPFSPDLSWSDAGGDSIKAMELIMRLETVLGHKVAFDVLGVETTPSELANAIRRGTAVPDPELPFVHLIPGVGGDEPILADLRRAFGDVMAFGVVDLPGLEAPASRLISLKETAAIIADEIGARQESGPVRLAGFSYGGFLAFEVAQQLTLAGRPIEFVCLFDPGVQDMMGASTRKSPEPKPIGRKERFQAGLTLAWNAVRGVPEPVPPPTDGPRKTPRHWTVECLFDLRSLSIEHYAPEGALSCPALLVYTGWRRRRSPEYWRPLLPKLEEKFVDAKHVQLFEATALSQYQDVVSRFVATNHNSPTANPVHLARDGAEQGAYGSGDAHREGAE